MADVDASIRSHYGAEGLAERMLRALADAGHDAAHPTVEMLARVDQLHGGGLNATIAQARFAGVVRGERVLDAGCGVGGTSRYLAASFDCRVEAIDLTPEFVEAAARLDALCGLAGRIAVRQGSVTDLPYADGSFDLVWSQYVSMNVPDKARMFGEAFRVLVPGGRFTIGHVAAGPGGAPYYPLPWAREPAMSFLETPEAILAALRTAGFGGIRVAPPAARPAAPQAGPGPGVIMGADMPERSANAMRSREEGRLVDMLILAERPA